MSVPRTLPLDRLLRSVPVLAQRRSGAPAPVRAVVIDSRVVGPGALFVALPGARFDAHAFLPQVAAAGALAALVECSPAEVPPEIPHVVQVADTRASLAQIARTFYGDPASDLSLVGITGTNGKTTVSFLLQSLLAETGHPAGRIGTLGYGYGGVAAATRNTTPESLELQGILRQMVDAGVRSVALEVSSHALASHRVDGLTFAVRLFTNLSRDHLDHHGTLEAYFAAKRRLLSGFGAGPRWVNADDPWGRRLLIELPGCSGFSAEGAPGAAVRVVERQLDEGGIRASLDTPWGPVTLRSPLLGRFNLDNLLAAAAAAGELGLSAKAIEAGLVAARGAPGRLQPVTDPVGRVQVFVDYAHTPAALSVALAALRPHTRGRLVVVFGCGGERDPGKRAPMGTAAAAGADLLIVTDDNPRGERSDSIIEQIVAGVPAGTELRVQPDRRAAIMWAIAQAQPQDVLLIAGKGAERYQERGGVRLPFDDAACAREALVASGRRQGV